MISQGVVIRNGQVLLVKQHVMRGGLVWNFPGGGIEEGESPEEACIREVKEETGYEVRTVCLLNRSSHKYTFEVEIVGGEIGFDPANPDNGDIVDIAWVSLRDQTKFDSYTTPIIDLWRVRHGNIGH